LRYKKKRETSERKEECEKAYPEPIDWLRTLPWTNLEGTRMREGKVMKGALEGRGELTIRNHTNHLL